MIASQEIGTGRANPWSEHVRHLNGKANVLIIRAWTRKVGNDALITCLWLPLHTLISPRLRLAYNLPRNRKSFHRPTQQGDQVQGYTDSISKCTKQKKKKIQIQLLFTGNNRNLHTFNNMPYFRQREKRKVLCAIEALWS